jgi:DNA-binding MarR family transcriptional regulator
MTDDGIEALPVELGPLGRDLPFMLRSLRGFIRGAVADTFAGLEAAPGDIAILNLVGSNPGVSQNALADILVLKKSAVTKAIKSLEARGLISRQKGRDRRFNALALTPQGKDRLRQIGKRMDVQHRLLFEGVPEDELAAFFRQLMRLLVRLYGFEQARRGGRAGGA